MCTTTKGKVIDIEDLNKKYDSIIQRNYEVCTDGLALKYKSMVQDIAEYARSFDGKTNHESIENRHEHGPSWDAIKNIMRRHSFSGKHSMVFQMFTKLVEMGDSGIDVTDAAALREVLKIKRLKSHSGVLVITIFTSPHPEYIEDDGALTRQEFSCHWNCAYCPNEPDMPRSYLKGEPGVLRATKNEFDCVRQMWDRMRTLYLIGHNVDKLEVIVLGGTWASYPLRYREQFIRDMYYAANTFSDKVDARRQRLTLQEERDINRTAATRIIGLTLETRPDTINNEEIARFRSYGCTRVQLGIQHLDDGVLDAIKRRCTTEQVKNAIRLLKDSCYKIDGHFMPNLPTSNPEKDRDMLINTLLGMKTPIIKRWETDEGKNGIEYEQWDLSHDEFQLDQWKVYPCAITPWTEIEKWYREGTYVPYEEKELEALLLDMKTLIFPWIRLNRIVRDIPSDYIIDSSDKPNMRQELAVILEREGKRCNCIRCREVKETKWDGGFVTRVREYNGSGGIEYFVAAESKDANTLYGFLRLRITDSPNVSVFPELERCGMVRELHVYGQLQNVGLSASSSHVQHRGVGKHLLAIAELLARKHNKEKMAVIAGEGTKQYYMKNGYIEDNGLGNFMIKNII